MGRGVMGHAVFGPKFEEIRKMGVIDLWLEEKYQQGIEQGFRDLALSVMLDRFGQLPAEVIERIQRADAQWCRNLVRAAPKARALEARALEDLDLS